MTDAPADRGCRVADAVEGGDPGPLSPGDVRCDRRHWRHHPRGRNLHGDGALGRPAADAATRALASLVLADRETRHLAGRVAGRYRRGHTADDGRQAGRAPHPLREKRLQPRDYRAVERLRLRLRRRRLWPRHSRDPASTRERTRAYGLQPVQGRGRGRPAIRILAGPVWQHDRFPCPANPLGRLEGAKRRGTRGRPCRDPRDLLLFTDASHAFESHLAAASGDNRHATPRDRRTLGSTAPAGP